jgi:hypothetical protein
MADRHPSYGDEIRELKDRFEETQSEAGPEGPHCPFAQEALDNIDKEIWEIAQAALDRYEDWVSDPLP